MIIPNVPFIDDHEQRYASCQGPPSVMMVFKHFRPEEKIDFDDLYLHLGYRKGIWFFETYITRFFAKQDIPAMYYSTGEISKIGKDAQKFEELCGLDFNKKEDRDALDIANYDSGVDFVLSKGFFKKMHITLGFMKKQLSKNRLIIATVNRNRLAGIPGYKGHFIVIKGFDEHNFICNDAYLGEDLKVPFNKFEDAFYYPDQSGKNPDVKICDMVVIG
jgi:hypothetical protein